MVQPYPSRGKPPIEAPRPPAPPSVVNAVKLMYTGAAVSTVSLIISLLDIGGTKAAIRAARPNLTATQVNQLNTFIISLAIVSGLLGIALWLWMAWANRQGKNWARIVSTVLFGLATLDTLVGLAAPQAAAVRAWWPVIWLCGLIAVIFLWQRASTDFFKGSTRS